MLDAREQPAGPLAGSRTVRSGLRILAVSAMNRTPQNTITSACTVTAMRLSSRESPR